MALDEQLEMLAGMCSMLVFVIKIHLYFFQFCNFPIRSCLYIFKKSDIDQSDGKVDDSGMP